MNPIELVSALPDWEWTDHCQREILLTGEELVEESDFVWRVGNVATAGFIYNSLTSPPWMWFVLAKGVGIRDLVDFRRIARFIPKGTTTAVDGEFKTGMRFAKLYDFEDTGKTMFHPNGKTYKLMRKK